jgi:hypothetical protein
MNFGYKDLFNLKISSPENNLSKVTNKKSLEYIFCEEKDFDKIQKKVWWNFRQNLSKINTSQNWSPFSISIDNDRVALSPWYFESASLDNIFYDYFTLIFEINDDFEIEINDDHNSFLTRLKKDGNKNIYKLWIQSSIENDKIYWFWWFIKIRIFNQENSYIFSPFFKTRNLEEDEHVWKMLEHIKEELYYSLFTYKNIASSWYKLLNKRDSKVNGWSFIKIFELIFKDLEKSILDITKDPKFKNISCHQTRKYNWWKLIVDNWFIKDSLCKWYFDIHTNKLNIFWRNIRQRTVKWDYNNTSNKIFIDLNQHLVSKLEYFIKLSEGKIWETFLSTIKSKKNIIKRERISFINRYDIDLVKLWNYSVDYQHLDSRYKKFVLNYLMLFSTLDLLNGELTLANKSIDQIYEYWTLISVRDLFYKILGSKGEKPLFKIKFKKNDLIFELWNNESVKIQWYNWEASIIYKFQQSINTIPLKFTKINSSSNKSKIPFLRTLSSRSIPDIFVELKKNNNFEYIVFDAKYSTNGNIKSRFDNLYKYKSWILNCEELEWNGNKWNGNIKNLDNLEVIAIYPWVKNEELESIMADESIIETEENVEIDLGSNDPSDKLVKLYEKSVSDVWFWGYIMNPKSDLFTDIEKYLKLKI